MRNWIKALAVLVAGAVLLPETAAADETYIISAEAWAHYQTYLRKTKNGLNPGAYAITKDGYNSYYFTCSQTNCMPGLTYSQDALNACEREYNTECVVFAVRDDIRVKYEIAKAPSTSSVPNLSPAPPVTKLSVSASVKAEIDQYLQNAQRAGRVWALAIANDGSKVGVASCQSTGGGGYFGGGGAGCNLVSGGPQEQASREAVQRCGGPTACVLLYEGSQKNASVSVYGPGETPPADTLGAAAPVLPSPPPAKKIAVSADIAEEIETYLRNAQRAGRAWALAIGNDGSTVGIASCPLTGSFIGAGAGCVLAGAQDQARREAIVRCGGAAVCTIAFEGGVKKTGIDLVGPDGRSIVGTVAAAPAVTNPAPAAPAPAQQPVTSQAAASPAPAVMPESSGAPDPAPTTGTYTVSDAVWGNYQAYVQKIGAGAKPGAFAITPDGKGYAYVWCEQTQCSGSRSYSQEALIDCKQDYKTDCVVFAVRNDIRVAYVVADPEPSRSSGVSQAALSAPPAPTRITVSAAVKTAIEEYLDNAQRAGRASALAVSQNGSEVGTASCPTSGGWSGGRACEPIKGSPQELASREAVMRCGGPAACVLLYEGAQPAGNIEILTQ